MVNELIAAIAFLSVGLFLLVWSRIRDLKKQVEFLSSDPTQVKKQIESLSKIIHTLCLVMHKANMILYDPLVSNKVSTSKAAFGFASHGQLKVEVIRNISDVLKGFPSSHSAGAPFVIRKVLNGSTSGYLAKDDTWTIDPRKIKEFLNRSDASRDALALALALASLPVPAGMKIEVYP